MMLRAAAATGFVLLLCGAAAAQANRNPAGAPALGAAPNIMPAPLTSIRPGTARPTAPSSAAPRSLPPPAARAAPPAALGDDMPTLDELSATRERPLFSSTRRPPEAEPMPQQAAPVAENTPMPFELVGVVIGAEVTAAIFRNTDTKEETRVAKGEKIGNWSVEEVSERAVILQGNAKRVRMRLFDEATAPGLQVGRPDGTPDADKADAQDIDNEPVDEEISPANSPQVRPATAQPRRLPGQQAKQRQGRPLQPRRSPRQPP